MTYVDGKDYKITTIGQYRRGLDVFYVNGLGIPALEVQNAEPLPDPLPTTPGSVVEHNGAIYCLTQDTSAPGGPWKLVRDGFGRLRRLTSRDLEGATVLFDAGADRG